MKEGYKVLDNKMKNIEIEDMPTSKTCIGHERQVSKTNLMELGAKNLTQHENE